MSPGRRRRARTSTVARANALVWPRALLAPRFAVAAAAGFLIVETVLVVLLTHVGPEGSIGMACAVLLGVAMVGNFVVAVAVAVSFGAARRRGAESSSDPAHMDSRTEDVQSSHRLERFFDLTSDLVVIADQGKLLKVNPAFEQALGYTVDDLAPAPFELVPPEDMDQLREPIKDLTDGRGPVRFENRATTRDGSSRWIEWSVAAHQGLFYAVGRDVTGQRQEQEQLRETRTMLEASRDTLRELAEHQAGLRRVATLVARGANPVEVFDAVYDEMAQCMHVTDARLSRYDDDETATILTARHEPGMQNLSGGTRLTLADDELLSKVLSSGQRAAIRTAIGVPV